MILFMNFLLLFVHTTLWSVGPDDRDTGPDDNPDGDKPGGGAP